MHVKHVCCLFFGRPRDFNGHKGDHFFCLNGFRGLCDAQVPRVSCCHVRVLLYDTCISLEETGLPVLFIPLFLFMFSFLLLFLFLFLFFVPVLCSCSVFLFFVLVLCSCSLFWYLFLFLLFLVLILVLVLAVISVRFHYSESTSLPHVVPRAPPPSTHTLFRRSLCS